MELAQGCREESPVLGRRGAQAPGANSGLCLVGCAWPTRRGRSPAAAIASFHDPKTRITRWVDGLVSDDTPRQSSAPGGDPVRSAHARMAPMISWPVHVPLAATEVESTVRLTRFPAVA